ncbi:MAG: hypothetical protein Q9188_007277 [Gyalolechia gomerana]
MTTFQSVNVGLGAHDHQFGVTTPTTPRAPSMPQSQTQSATIVEEQSSATPTRLSFSGLNGQRPLPTSPFPSSFTTQAHSTDQSTPGALSREHSHRSTQSTGSQDIDMDMSEEGEGASDDESVDAETGNILEKGRFSVTVLADFQGWITYDNMHRRSMSTKKSLETRWQLPEPDSRGRFGLTGFEHQLVDREHQRPVVKVAMAEATVVIYQLPALAQRLLL